MVGRAGIGLDNVDVDAATAPRRDGGQRAADATSSRPPSTRWRCCSPRPATCRRRTPRSSPVAGSEPLGGRRARRQDARHRRPRPDRQARRRPRQGVPMRLVAYDPFVSADRARQMGVELLALDQVVGESDFLTIHLPKTKETAGLINRDLLLKAKPTLRVINVARGGIVVESDLADCIRDGVIAGAALDVFDAEPTTDVAAVRARPASSSRRTSGPVDARGAGQGRRHDRRHGAAGARRRVRAVRRQRRRRRGQRDAAPVPAARRAPRPAVRLARRRGRPSSFECCFEGDIAGYDTRILGLAVLKGFFGGISDEPVTLRQRPAAREGGRDRRPRGQLHDVGRLRQPHHPRGRRSLASAAH